LGYTSGAKDPGGTGFSGQHSAPDFGAMMRHEITLGDLMRKHGEPSRFKQGATFIYNGLDSEALSLVVRGATGMVLPAWFESTVWQKAGGEHEAAWFTDKDGNGVAEALVWTTSRDFLRIGIYAFDRLTNKSSDACMNAFVQEAAQPKSYKGDYWKYPAPSWGFGMHVGADKSVWFMGHGGQRLALNPKSGRILVMNSFREWRGMDADLVRLFTW
jgi:CubicO group peptidase (beta-lactamase class C family)